MIQYIFNKYNAENYCDILKDFNLGLDIYYYPSYLSFDAKIQGGEFEIFVLIENEFIFIYPYIKIGFNISELKNKFDIISPYGYCGPYSNNPLFFKRAELFFIKYASVFCVTEFIRYHYL
ncbi:MAG: GNAT family N-acetyltransferase, partial [Chitinophagia bacterium]